jgi:hypothetical protein
LFVFSLLVNDITQQAENSHMVITNQAKNRQLGVKRWQLCLRDTSRSANCHRRAAVGHWISLCVNCSGMVDLPRWQSISIQANIVRPSVNKSHPRDAPRDTHGAVADYDDTY